MVGIIDKVVRGSYRYLSVSVIGRAYFPNIFNIVQKGMHIEYIAHTVALAVWWELVDIAAVAPRKILQELECSFGVRVVAGN